MMGGVFNEIAGQIWLVAAVFIRIAAALSMAPGYGEKSVSVRVRLPIAFFLSLAIAPVVEPYLPERPPDGREMALFLLRETGFGLFLGLCARGIVFLLEMTGTVISQTISLAQMLGTATEPMPVISHILTVTGLALIFTTSLGDQIIYAFVASYYAELPSWSDLVSHFAKTTTALLDFLFRNAVLLGSGFIGLFFVYYLFIGFVNKAMPQFMVSFIGIPFVALFSIYFLLAHGELLLTVWQEKARTILMMAFEGAE
ncbi:flagellar biosynthetic protein FliR [Marivita sp. GX14005]|uniref:flagellar biosynthetic protein FliR n=1 Tax=Marivita sp. GX14005 TaxID=2942276 RepID=UPI002019288F|nr:flagellar biosynthetic protein FliR [Marivita sp. GX14005]MCL3881692.1 flagellar biosynthetic protein FliR [Marivita sp. GX14005]